MSLWQRTLAWLRGERTDDDRAEDAAQLGAPPYHALDQPPEPAVLRPPEESWLAALAADVAEGHRLGVIASQAFWERLDTLWKKGHERLAVQWLEKFLASPARPAEAEIPLRRQLVEWQVELGEVADATPHLERLTEIEETAARAHYLLAEGARRAGDEARALRHYEAVLARDVDYPNVRARIAAIRRARGADTAAAAGDTVIGPEAQTSGARYRLLRELGRGASGAVYLARDAELERDVAVKLLHPHLAGDERAEALARFFDEARAAASLRHPNIIAILDLDERARRLVMELAAGGTLRDVLRTRGPRPLRRALQRHAQILSALVAAHRRGIVHRDLKPANLMFRRDPDAPGAEIVLADFGVAHLPTAGAAPRGDRAQTDADARGGEAVGTLAYMAPEQRRGAEADPRADLYAAAVVLFEMLTGSSPWSREVLLSGARAADDFRLPDAVTTGADQDLRERLADHLRALGAPDPNDRPDSERALGEARELRDRALIGAAA
jgi:hypothetical protein